jgi:ribonuclease III
MEFKPLSELEKTLQYIFKNRPYLEESLQHSSYVNEQAGSGLYDNERLEFLGDAVINLVVGHLLMKQFPDLQEGELSRMRAHLVNETQLAEVARDMDLGSHIRLGKGELQSEGQKKPSILADTLEALVAAVYLDGGFDAAFRIIASGFSGRIHRNGDVMQNHDYKSQLQELVQTTQKNLPIYTVIREEGPDHDKTFQIGLKVGDLVTHGTGKSKKSAEQAAAEKGLELLKRTM